MDNYNFPDQNGHFGPYGGTFVAETLIEALDELKEMYNQFKDDKEFLNEFHHDLKHYVGRPSKFPHLTQWNTFRRRFASKLRLSLRS